MGPLKGHLAHIRNLASPAGLAPVLKERHGFRGQEAREFSKTISPFIAQGLQFFEASNHANHRVRPVLQYYAYLNLAVATVLIFRPPNWHAYRSHGAEDFTRSLKTISLSSKVVRVRKGVITLFHSILCAGALPKGPIRLKDLLIPIRMISSELHHAFNIAPLTLTVNGRVQEMGDPGKQKVASCFDLEIVKGPHHRNPVRFPSMRIGSAMPILRDSYDMVKKQP